MKMLAWDNKYITYYYIGIADFNICQIKIDITEREKFLFAVWKKDRYCSNIDKYY